MTGDLSMPQEKALAAISFVLFVFFVVRSIRTICCSQMNYPHDRYQALQVTGVYLLNC
jgi:hypothetical protein